MDTSTPEVQNKKRGRPRRYAWTPEGVQKLMADLGVTSIKIRDISRKLHADRADRVKESAFAILLANLASLETPAGEPVFYVDFDRKMIRPGSEWETKEK